MKNMSLVQMLRMARYLEHLFIHQLTRKLDLRLMLNAAVVISTGTP